MSGDVNSNPYSRLMALKRASSKTASRFDKRRAVLLALDYNVFPSRKFVAEACKQMERDLNYVQTDCIVCLLQWRSAEQDTSKSYPASAYPESIQFIFFERPTASGPSKLRKDN